MYIPISELRYCVYVGLFATAALMCAMGLVDHWHCIHHDSVRLCRLSEKPEFMKDHVSCETGAYRRTVLWDINLLQDLFVCTRRKRLMAPASRATPTN